MIEVALDEPRVRREPDEDEHPADCQRRLFTRLRILEPQLVHPLGVALDLLDHFVPNHLDLRVGKGALLNDRRRPQLVSSVDDVDLGRVSRQVVRLLDGRISSADDCQHFSLEERPVTHRTVRDATSGELLLPPHPQLAGCSSGRDDHGRCPVLLLQLRGDIEGAVRSLGDRLHRVHHELGPEFLGVIGHALCQFRALDALEADVVLDEIGVEELTTRHAALDHERLEHSAACVHRGAEPGGSGADDDHIVSLFRLSILGCHVFLNCSRRSGPTRLLDPSKSGSTPRSRLRGTDVLHWSPVPSLEQQRSTWRSR